MPSSAHCGDAAGTVVATIGDEKVYREEIDDLLMTMAPEERERVTKDPSAINRVLRGYVSGRVLADLARSRGDFEPPWLARYLESVRDREIANQLIQREVKSTVTVPEDDVRLQYDMNKSRYSFPESVRARHILVAAGQGAGEEQKKAARERAESIRREIMEGGSFEVLAREKSDDRRSGDKGGDLGWITADRVLASFADALFALEPGEVSEVVETKYGFHIIKMEERRPGGVTPFEMVKGEIATQLRGERETAKVKEFVDNAMEAAAVTFFPERLLMPVSGGGVDKSE